MSPADWIVGAALSSLLWIALYGWLRSTQRDRAERRELRRSATRAAGGSR